MTRIPLLIVAASSIALTGCGEKQATDNISGVEQATAAKGGSGNSITSIDAATGADSNMAADVDVNRVDNADDTDGSPKTPRAKTRVNQAATTNNNAAAAPEPVKETAAPANSTD